jgi:hypothetical protein
MALRSRIGLAVAVAAVFSLVNFAGGIVAAVQGEPLHAAGHAALFLICVAFVWWFTPGREVRNTTHAGEPAKSPFPSELSGRLTRLEQALEAVAIEIERIGEGQQSITRALTERGAARTVDGGDTESVESKPREMAPPDRS